uniref:Uncharacterized protein n=1 Tax=Panagrolaimus davidi TaxID=227884 RepID=A0A914QH78_9BILA
MDPNTNCSYLALGSYPWGQPLPTNAPPTTTTTMQQPMGTVTSSLTTQTTTAAGTGNNNSSTTSTLSTTTTSTAIPTFTFTVGSLILLVVCFVANIN